MLSRIKGSVRRVSVVMLIVGCSLFIIATPVFAQEGTANPTNQGPAGIGILILLMGLAAIGLVGVSYAAQTRSDQAEAARHAKHTDEAQ